MEEIELDFNINISKAIKFFRKKNEMTQGDIFRATGLERSYISRLESGEIKYPKIKTIFKLAKSFNISVTRFLYYAEHGEDLKT